jgi:hypothetical protein
MHDFFEKLFQLLFAWLPSMTWTVEMSTESGMGKAKAFLVMVVAGFLLYKHLVKPVVITCWAIFWSLVCALSVIGVSIYAAYKHKRLGQLHWHRLPTVILSRWFGFMADGYNSTTVTHAHYIWRSPFDWTLRAQAFREKQPREKVTDNICDEDEDDDFDLPEESFKHLGVDKESEK